MKDYNENQNINGLPTLEKQFAEDCKIIDLKYEYPGYTGTEKFGIITPLSEKELEKYSALLTTYVPYIVLPISFGEIQTEYKKNEVKHAVRLLRGHIYGIDNEFESHHIKFGVSDFTSQLYQDPDKRLMAALSKLRVSQRTRLIKMFFDGYSNDEIAKQEGKSASAISQSIKGALKKLEEILQKP